MPSNFYTIASLKLFYYYGYDMDTVEELNGTYFYKGICNISASELFFWIFLDTTDEQFGGLKDAVMMATMILGLPILETRTKPETATIGTSVASKYLRDLLNVQLPHRLPTITLASFKYRKPMYTKNLGAFIGRWIPALGITILAADLATISYKTLSRYNTIAHPKDRIW